MRKIIVAKKTGKNSWKAYKMYAFSKSEIAEFIIMILAVGYIVVRALI